MWMGRTVSKKVYPSKYNVSRSLHADFPKDMMCTCGVGAPVPLCSSGQYNLRQPTYQRKCAILASARCSWQVLGVLVNPGGPDITCTASAVVGSEIHARLPALVVVRHEVITKQKRSKNLLMGTDERKSPGLRGTGGEATRHKAYAVSGHRIQDMGHVTRRFWGAKRTSQRGTRKARSHRTDYDGARLTTWRLSLGLKLTHREVNIR